jgi:hypothetical protein
MDMLPTTVPWVRPYRKHNLFACFDNSITTHKKQDKKSADFSSRLLEESCGLGLVSIHHSYDEKTGM